MFAKASQPERKDISGNIDSGKKNAKSSVVQRLAIGPKDDPFETEADNISDQVMRKAENSFIQRKCAHCEKEEKLMRKPSTQSKSENGSVVQESISGVIQSSLGHGMRLDNRAESFMSSRFGSDFSEVKIHTDSEAAQLSRNLNAKAFTTGSDIFFNEGAYQPESADGRKLLAHELTHVLQQRSGSMLKKIQRYTTDDCSDDQRDKLTTAYPLAKEMLSNAISRLTADPVTAETQRIFANHFGAYAPWRRDIVLSFHLRPMRTILNNSEMNFECEEECDNEKAYTYWIFGDVHLCPGFFSSSENEAAETIIHELFHLRGAFDLGYHGNNEDADTWWSAAINNADSFSELCQDLYEQP